jgi:flagellin
MSDVFLSGATRASITALQQISHRMDVLQARLASGKRVNSPSDDPAAFFASTAMSARAATLNSLLSNMATAQGAIDAANKGIATIQSLLASAQNVANAALQSTNTTGIVTVTGNNSSALTTATVIASNSGSSTKFKAGDTVTVSDGTTTATYTAASNDTVQTVLNAVNTTANLKVTASLNSAGQIQLQTTTAGVNVTVGGTLTGSGTLNGIIGLTAGTTAAAANTVRQNLATQFDSLRTQIDQAAQDASFNGVNLLTSSSLAVAFNETGSSKLTISGAQLNSNGLGLAASTGQFQTDSDVNTALANVSKALTTLQAQSAVFGSTAAIMQARTDFTKAMINTLNDGADALVATDSNEDGAALLALQTRQQIATMALSMAHGQDTTTLRLFGL